MIRAMVEPIPNPMDLAVARRLTAIRESLGMTATEMASLMNVSKSAYSAWERGVGRLSLNGALRLKEKVGVPLDFIYFGEVAALPANRIKDWASRS
jgi:transcriptional regulator with XRE-family HTH domain